MGFNEEVHSGGSEAEGNLRGYPSTPTECCKVITLSVERLTANSKGVK